MTRFALIILIIVSLIAGACSSRKNKVDKKNRIPEKELVSILTDIYIAGGLFSIPKTCDEFPVLDTVSLYHHIIEKHGYTKEAMDQTMKYYFIKKPKKLIVINDKVLGILSEMESLNEQKMEINRKTSRTLWPGSTFYSFPDPTGSDSASFNITLDKKGNYSLTFSVTLYPDDQTFNPGLTIYSCHPDSIATGKLYYLESQKFFKDGYQHTYNLILKVPDDNPVHFQGCLFDYENLPDEWGKHFVIENISLTLVE